MRPQETFEDAVLGMVHVALNQGRTSVEIATQQPHKTRLLLLVSQIVLAVDHGQPGTAFSQLAELQDDVAKRRPDPMEYRALSVCRGMFDTAVGPGPMVPDDMIGLMWMSRLFTDVYMSGWPQARESLERAITAMKRGDR
jgi:hypothetical protein